MENLVNHSPMVTAIRIQNCKAIHHLLNNL
jgi:hypothetical protein